MPKSKNRKIPKFKSYQEEARFWDSHSFADYWEEWKPAELEFVPTQERKATMSIRVSPTMKRETERIARNYDIPASSLVRMWMVDKIREFRHSLA